VSSEIVSGLDATLDRDVYRHCFSRFDREVGGVLVGTIDGVGPSHVIGAIPALQATESAASITFTQEAWSFIHRTLDTAFPGCEILGWYHTHPGYGLFLSAQDVFIQTNFFNGPSQIAVVIDPAAGQEAVFAWRGGEIVRIIERPTRFRGTGNAGAGGGATDAVRVRPTRPLSTYPDIGGTSSLSLASCIYLAIIGLSFGVSFWELALR
jgi:proteasome lid subunit RPN8/RPN11